MKSNPALKTLAVLFFSLFFFVFAFAETKKVCVKNTCIQAEVADSDFLRQKGLMFKDRLGDSQGMLFVFRENGRHNFWMKNMKFSLDIIWIDEDKKIVDIQKSVPPCGKSCPDLVSSKESRYVLEVNSGFVEKNQIGLGDRLSF